MGKAWENGGLMGFEWVFMRFAMLVGDDWNMTFISHSVGNGNIIPIDEFICFRGIETTNQNIVYYGFIHLISEYDM